MVRGSGASLNSFEDWRYNVFDNSFYGTGNFGGWQISVGNSPQPGANVIYPQTGGTWGTGGVYTGGVNWPGAPAPARDNQLLILLAIGLIVFMAVK